MTAGKERQRKAAAYTLALVTVLCALLWHYLGEDWGFYRNTEPREAALRRSTVEAAQSWLGANEADGSHRAIIDLYNSHEPLAVGYTVQYTDSWCSAFVSAVSIRQDLTEILPTECGCERHIALFQALNRWQEADDHIPLPGDLIFYDWNETAPGDCTGWADHVGMVVGTKWPFVKVIEGNCEDQVQERVILLNNRTIRGYALPDYASLVP